MKRIGILVLALMLSAVMFGSALAEGIVDINTATVEELLSIPHTNMTNEQAQAIVDYRTKNGKFALTDDLLRVPGMSNEVWQAMGLVETDDSVVYDPDADEMTFAPSKC